MDDVLKIAKSCRHFAMCKIDFLGSGVCASGLDRHYVTFYPEGRMDLYAALSEHRIPITEKCVEVAESCDLCGKCDHQCYFVTELRPTRVMEALKDLVAGHVKKGGAVEKPPTDPALQDIRGIVGEEWATNDRAVAVTYSHDPGPFTVPKMPAYVVLPGTRDEAAALLRLLNSRSIPWVVRGNGSQNAGLVFSEGAVIDLNRMKGIAFDEKNWAVKVGAGVSAFDLQSEAARRGFRVNVAEPAALVCSNMICSGIFSTFLTAYGTAAENCVDAEFVARDGSFFSLGAKDAPNLFAFKQADQESPGICTSVTMKLHPVTGDEAGVLVPFDSLDKALAFSKECAVRRIGLAIGILGGGYISSFLAPTMKLAGEVRDVFEGKLGIAYLVLVIGDRHAIQGVQAMGLPFFDQRLFRALSLGLPSLRSSGWPEILGGMEADEPFSYLRVKGFADIAETALAPSAALLAQSVEPELRPFFEEVYGRPEMTDLVWLNMFRILSSRMGREKQFAVNIVFLPLEQHLIAEITAGFKGIADRQGLTNGLGFITPIDSGKRCILEYDYFFDQTDPDEIAKARQAAMEAGGLIMESAARTGTIRWIRHVVNQG
ncbi:MAG TPA: FAD-binding oxidoreductase, partial [Terriglobales bacterium]|nr:FAD-binding oxidoreductase [Terriglobales bacterium]